jgi:transcriptional regulator with XRE-family HTH domain
MADEPTAESSEHIGAYLGRLRKQRGLSPTELARQAGIGRSTIYHYEGDNRIVGYDVLCKLQPILGFSWAEIESYRQLMPRRSAPAAAVRVPAVLADVVITQADLEALLQAESNFRPLTYKQMLELLSRRLSSRKDHDSV